MCGFRAPLPGLNAGARPHLQHRSHCHRATAYRRNRGSTFAAINHPSASRNLCQNQLIRQFTALPTGKRRLRVASDWALAGSHPDDVALDLPAGQAALITHAENVAG